MSLLLDALQRASQEKEKLAESRASADKLSAPSEPLSPLAIEQPPTPPDPLPDVAAGPKSAEPPALDFAPEAPSFPTELTLDPLEQAVKEPPSAPATASSATTKPEANQRPDPIAPEPATDRTLAAASAPAPAAARIEPTSSPRSPVNNSEPVKSAASAHPSPTISPQVAREILGATAKTSARGPNRRLIFLGVFALLFALANAAFFMGFMDQLLGLASPTPVQSIAVAPLGESSAPPPASSPVAGSEGPGVSESPASAEARPDAGNVASTTKAEPMPSSPASPAPGRDEVSSPASPSRSQVTTARAPAARAASKASGAKTAQPVFVAKSAPVSVLDMAYAALTEGRFDDAVDGYKRVLEKTPSERDALFGLAYIAHRQGRRDDAQTYYQRVLRLQPGHPGASAGLLALAAEGDLQLTASRAREMAERNPNSAVVLSTLAGLLAKEGRIAEAQQEYFKAFTLEPDNALHAFNLAVALDRLHKYSQAQDYYQRALALAEKSGAAEKSGFPRMEALQRHEQLRARESGRDTLSAGSSSDNGKR